MPKRGYRFRLDGTLLVIMALFLLGGLIALGFLRNLTKENRALIVIATSLVILGCFVCLILLSAYRKWLRRRVWLKAMVAWQESSRAGIAPNFAQANHLTEDELRSLAIRIYSRMGYRIAPGGGETRLLRLLNPDDEYELMTCIQQQDILELHYVYSFYLEMKRAKAVRGYFWAPAGFTSEAMKWVAHRSIVLADQIEIGRLVDCGHAQGSRFLEH